MSNLKSIVKEEGILSLWKGSLFPLICYGLCSSIMFSVNENMKKIFKKNNNQSLTLTEFFICGSTAGLANSIVSSPMEHIRIRLQI